jgi:hypothetical protein
MIISLASYSSARDFFGDNKIIMQAGWMLEEDLIIVLGSPSQSKRPYYKAGM